MDSRERILSALAFRTPDKVPIDFGGHRSSGISAIAYSKLKKALGITSGDIYVYDMIQQLAIIEDPVLERFQVDTIELGRAFMKEKKYWKEWVLPDGTPCKIPSMVNVEKRGEDWILLSDEGIPLGIQKKGTLFFEQIHFPMKDRDFNHEDFMDLDEQSKLNMWSATPAPGNEYKLEGEDLSIMKEKAAALRSLTDRAIIGLFGGSLFETPQMLFGMENYLMNIALYPNSAIRLSERLCDNYCRDLEKWLSAVGPYIDIVLFGDDLGSNQGPLIDPEMYRKYFKPFHKKMWDLVKTKMPHLKILLHSCGSVEAYLEDLIDAGLDAINPVQISAAGMSLDSLKVKYRDRITFWGGGCDTQSILNSASPDEIEDHVKKQIAVMKGEGGFVFQQVHNILVNVSSDKIIRMFDTIIRYR